MACDHKCWYAEEEICNCECRGRNHGTYKPQNLPDQNHVEKIKPWTQEQEKAYKEFISTSPELQKITGMVPEPKPEPKPTPEIQQSPSPETEFERTPNVFAVKKKKREEEEKEKETQQMLLVSEVNST